MVSSPEIIFPCYYGIDTSDKNELIAANMKLEEIRESIGVESLHFISLDGMLSACERDPGDFCAACFNGHYPVEVTDQNISKYDLEGGKV